MELVGRRWQVSCVAVSTVSSIPAVELVGRRWRVPCGTILNYFTTLGGLLTGGLAVAIRDWVQLQLATSGPLVLLFTGFW